MSAKKKMQFPKRFLWGVSVSAYQVEGGNKNQWSVWEFENAKSLAAQASYQYGDLASWRHVNMQATDPDNYISGKAVDHYRRYKEDFKIAAKELNMNSFRFSIEWSRIEPNEGEWNQDEIEHYRAYISTMVDQGLEPVMTLFHFTLPVWFAEKGGFAKRSNVQYYLRFVEKVVRELGHSVRYILTMNEIGIYARAGYTKGFWPPGTRSLMKSLWVFHNLIYAHNKASKLIHSINRRHKVSLATNMSNIHAGNRSLSSRFMARTLGWYRNDYLLYRVKKHCDFIGLNYYFTDRVQGFQIDGDHKKVNDLGWDMNPGDIRYVIEHINKITGLPILVTENGVADAKDQYRAWWLSETLLAIQAVLQKGVPVLGYIHWSLLDNFEWREGKWPRFGLVEVDYKTMERTIRPSALRLAQVIRKFRYEQ